MKTWQILGRGQSILTRPRRLQLRRWTLLVCLRLLRSIGRWLQSGYPDPNSTQPLSGTLHRPPRSQLSKQAGNGSAIFCRDEPPLSRVNRSSPSGSPRSLNELSQAQLELALSVVHNQMYKPSHQNPFLVVWEPPQELSLLPQSEWLCLIEVWEQLLNQRRRSPLH
jgi:hypothetical protein